MRQINSILVNTTTPIAYAPAMKGEKKVEADAKTYDSDNMVCIRLNENSPFFAYEMYHIRFAGILPIEDPYYILTKVEEVHKFSNDARQTDIIKFVPESSSCTSGSAVTFTLNNDNEAVFRQEVGFENYKLCYNFEGSVGAFKFTNYDVNAIPKGDIMTNDEIINMIKKVRSVSTIVEFFIRGREAQISKVNDTIIEDATISLLINDISYSSKILSIWYGLNLDYNSNARKVVDQMTNATEISSFVGDYGKQVYDAYLSGNGENPQSLLLSMANSVNGNTEKYNAVINGWRSLASSDDVTITPGESGEATFTDGSTVTITPATSGRRLEESKSYKITLNQYECAMIDTEITEGKCIEVLIDGDSTNSLSSKVRLTYDKRAIDDTHCASKSSILATSWESREANNNNDCFFENGKAAIENTRFGVITTHAPPESSSIKFDPTVLSVILIMAIIIFVLLFLGLAYALYVYVTPSEPVDVDNLWKDFDEERKKNLEEKRAERAERKKQLLAMENEFLDSDDESEDYSDMTSDSFSVDSIYDQIMHPLDSDSEEYSDEVDESYTMAINSANESSRLAQQAAEMTEIVHDDEMEKEEGIGEVRHD